MAKGSCSVEGCERPALARVLCAMHYHRGRADGSLRLLDWTETFWEKVLKSDGCWTWTGSLSVHGYGKVTRQRRFRSAHRLAYELLIGPIPAGLTLDHLCRNRRCVKPAHLEPVTMRENLRRGDSPSAIARRTNRCKNGHVYTPENTYFWRGGRSCVVCRRIASATCRAKKSKGVTR